MHDLDIYLMTLTYTKKKTEVNMGLHANNDAEGFVKTVYNKK